MENDFYEMPSWCNDRNIQIHFVIGSVPEENKQKFLRDLNTLIEKLIEDLGEILNKSVSIVDEETYEKYKFYEFLLNAENKILTEEKR